MMGSDAQLDVIDQGYHVRPSKTRNYDNASATNKSSGAGAQIQMSSSGLGTWVFHLRTVRGSWNSEQF